MKNLNMELENVLDGILTRYNMGALVDDYYNFTKEIEELENIEDHSLYMEFDGIYEELCYDFELHNELMECGLASTSELMVYVCTERDKF